MWRSWKAKGEERGAHPHMEWGRQMAFVNHFWDHGAIPSPFAPHKPNLAAYAFWDDVWVDSSTSVRTAVTGKAQNRRFIVGGNVRFYINGSARVTFEAIFDENGTITFGYVDIDSTPLEQGGQANHGPIPSPPALDTVNAAIYPFWDDLWVDSSASVRTAVIRSAPNRQFVIEWRNVKFWVNGTLRVLVEVVISQNGKITIAWKDVGANTTEQGGSATSESKMRPAPSRYSTHSTSRSCVAATACGSIHCCSRGSRTGPAPEGTGPARLMRDCRESVGC